MQENPKAYACIMAGGSGERFWPMSRRHTPKHLLKLFSDRTLVEETVRRLEGVVPLKNVFVLINRGGATGGEVMTLARAIQTSVYERFGIMLEPEPVVF